MIIEKNLMILNGVNIGISEVMLDSFDLVIIDKSKKYTFSVTVYYNWQDINKIKIGETKEIDFNEYSLAENNEPALVWPTKSYVQKLAENKIIFYFKFENLNDMNLNNMCYMNKSGKFDIEIKNLEVKTYVNYEDAKNGTVKYIY